MNIVRSIKKLFFVTAVGVSFFSSVPVFADVSVDLAASIKSIGEGVTSFGSIVAILTTIAVSFVFLYFFWNLAVYIKASGDDQKEQAKSKMGWSVLAIIVVTSLWGIIAFFRGVVGIGTGDPNDIVVPSVDFQSSSEEDG